MNFKKWLFSEDKFNWANFGSDKHFNVHPDLSPEETLKRQRYDDPIRQFNFEYLSEQLLKKRVGIREASAKYMHEIIWGEGSGALKVHVHPDNHVSLDKLGKDLQGEDVWYTKKMFLINRGGFGGHEDIVVEELHDALIEISKQPIDGPRNELDKKYFKNLVQVMAAKMSQVARPIFFLERIKKLNDYNYIIQFGVKGQGVEAPDHRRIEENLTQVIYDKNKGVIRVMNANVESGVGKEHSWEIMPNDSDYFFSPTQDKNEIIQVMMTTMKYY